MDALDISNFTSKFGASQVAEWRDQGIGLAIIQLISGVRLSGDSCQVQIETCLKNGLAVDCYLFPGNDGLGLSTAQRLLLVPSDARTSIRQLWIDIEPAYTNPNQPAINSSMAIGDKWGPWQKSGSYSALWVASKMGWLPWPWPNRKQWLVNATNVSNLGGGFSGTNNHVITQYQEDAIISGVSGIDRSLLAVSESDAVVQWLGGPMAIKVGDGMQAQMSASQDNPLCDHVFYEQTDDDGKVYEVEKCYGKKGIYISSNSSGTWVNIGPL